jgi:hypothetical protein
MRNQGIRVPAIAAVALLIALDCLCASTSAHTKTDRTRNKLYQVRPPPVHLIKCAGMFYGSPCWPDPGMLHLKPEPGRVQAPPDPPQFVPSR